MIRWWRIFFMNLSIDLWFFFMKYCDTYAYVYTIILVLRKREFVQGKWKVITWTLKLDLISNICCAAFLAQKSRKLSEKRLKGSPINNVVLETYYFVEELIFMVIFNYWYRYHKLPRSIIFQILFVLFLNKFLTFRNYSIERETH